MFTIRLKKNLGSFDMAIRIMLGGVLVGLGALRVFPGSFIGAAAAIILGTFLIIEGVARY
jgi:uncharacterized membrane protein HdeD (DUF308 family)